MLRRRLAYPLALLLLAPLACSRPPGAPKLESVAGSPREPREPSKPIVQEEEAAEPEFQTIAEQFKDIQILRYEVPDFVALSPKEKELLYYLYEAALSGRDITYDQKGPYNLTVRKTIEAIWRSYKGDRNTPAFKAFEVYAKQVWFSLGIHHHYSGNKLVPEFSAEDFAGFVRGAHPKYLPLAEDDTLDRFIERMTPVLFDPSVETKRTNRDPAKDPVRDSANNFYDRGITAKEVEAFYKKRRDPKDPQPIWYGLNSKLKRVGKRDLEEAVWKVGGMYGPAIERIVYWLEKAQGVAENPKQRAVLGKLIAYYKSGDLRDFDAYNIAWVADTESRIDTVNGFIEVYDDALGMRADYEAVVSFKDRVATKRIALIADNAQWFEDHSPIADEHKKKEVVGISAKVITVVVEGGDAAPSTPIGINLPNAEWIRKEHGSKSVNLGNIVDAYNKAKRSSGSLEEFASSPEEIARAQAHGDLAATLHTDMHEVIGHASGQLMPDVGTPKETLKSYASALEEARADLVALYFILDPKLVEIGVMPSLEVGKAEYDSYVRNALMVQLARLGVGEDLEESHMRNRHLVASWAFERGKADNVIERVTRDGKTYFVIHDYERLRQLFGELLAEIQRIKSTGDFEAGQALVEKYGVKVDPALHKEVLDRYQKLGIAPYSGFIQPRLSAVMSGDAVTEVRIEYPDNFAEQMIEYADKYSFLPATN